MVGVLAAGCGTLAHDKAVSVARAWTAKHDMPGRVACSNGIGGMHPRTPDFICQVRQGTRCDELRVHRYGGRWHVVVRRRGVDCVLPA